MSVRLSPGGIFWGGYYFYHDEYKKYHIHEKLPTHILASGIGIGCEQLHRAGGDHVSGGGGGTGHHHRGGGIGGSCAPLDSLLIFSGFWNDDDELLSDQAGGDVRVWMVSSIRSLLVFFFVSGWTEVSANLKVSTDQTHYW